MKYSLPVALSFFKSEGLPEPLVEHQFAKDIGRKWRFDFAFIIPTSGVKAALEVQGGLFVRGGHNRGAYMLKEHEKRNEAACRGWLMLYCQPSELCTMDTVNLLKRALQL